MHDGEAIMGDVRSDFWIDKKKRTWQVSMDGFCKCILEVLDSVNLVIPNLKEGCTTGACLPTIDSRTRGAGVHAT